MLSWRPAQIVKIPLSNKGGAQRGMPIVSKPLSVLPINVAKLAVSNGYVSPGSISTLLVPPIVNVTAPSFNEDHFLLDPNAAGAHAADIVDASPVHTVAKLPTQSLRTRANFIDPSITGATHPNRIAAATDHLHLASLGAISKLAAGLEVISEFNQDVPIRNPPPTFPAPADTPTLSYVGYVIERHELDQSGSMILSRTIDINDPMTKTVVDRQVRYGVKYAYRMRSVVQWTHPSDVGFRGQSALDRLPVFNPADPTPNKQASFYSGDWSDWSRVQVIDDRPPEPPDELTIMPISRRGVIRVVWKMPEDRRLDIMSLRLLRATSVACIMTDWRMLGEFVPGNGAFNDTDVLPIEEAATSYVYSMYSVSFHGLISVLSEQIEARITTKSKYREDEPLRQVRQRGADPMEHASGRQRANHEPLLARRSASFYCRGAKSGHPLFNRSYVVEVQSISTGDKAEVTLSVDSTDVDVGPTGSSGRA